MTHWSDGEPGVHDQDAAVLDFSDGFTTLGTIFDEDITIEVAITRDEGDGELGDGLVVLRGSIDRP